MSSRSLEASGRDRPAHDPWRHQGVRVDEEPDRAGGRVRAATVFLTGRECPWRCVMCDLWRYTTVTDTPAGAIPHQIADALSTLRASGEAAPPHLKLYNAGSFFDPRAVPPDDDEAIAAIVGPARRVIVESHPALVGDRTWRFQEQLRRFNRTHDCELEVAMGLETAHPDAFARLNKGCTVDDVVDAAAALAAHGVGLRVFLLVHPPFVARAERTRWLLRSIDVAIATGASLIALIPTRGDPPGSEADGAMAALAAQGDFLPPSIDDLEEAARQAMRHAAGRVRIIVDLWDLGAFASCPACLEARRAQLLRLGLRQCVPTAADAVGDVRSCVACGWAPGAA
jgi:radical SAM enzyme (TIGR01210 family)